jgi:uncharacterized membrane protein
MPNLGRAALNFAFLFALTIWGGMVFFFTFINTPAVFAGLNRDTAARLLGDLFPRYFQVQLICIAVALAALGVRVALGGAPRVLSLIGLAALGLALAIALYANFSLLPTMQEAQARVPSFVTTPREDPTRVAYGRLHGRAMILNATAALLGGATLALAAFDTRLLATRRERHGAAMLPERQTAADGAVRGALPVRSEG